MTKTCENCEGWEDCNTEGSFFAKLEEQLPTDIKLTMYNPSTDAVEGKTIGDYRGKWLVLFFYPADFSFVCPTELKDLAKRYDEIKAMGNIELLAVSVDSVFVHKAWIDTEPIMKWFPYCMVADRTTELASYFDIVNTTTGNAERGTYIISPEGVLKMIEISTDAVGRSAAELVRKLAGLYFVSSNPGTACPASWENNMPILRPSIKAAWHAENILEGFFDEPLTKST